MLNNLIIISLYKKKNDIQVKRIKLTLKNKLIFKVLFNYY